MGQINLHQKINIFSVLCAVLSFFILMVYWSEFTSTKRILLIFLIALILFLILKSSKKRPRKLNKVYGKLRNTGHDELRSKDDTLSRISNYLSKLGDTSQQCDVYGSEQQMQWNGNGVYDRQRLLRKGPRTSNYFTSYQGGVEYQQSKRQMNFKSDFSLYIPVNYNQIFEQIKQKICPGNFSKQFSQYLQKIKQTDRKSNLFPLQSTIVDSDRNCLLTESYDVAIKQQSYCAELLCDYLDNQLQRILRKTNTDFKQVSEVAMKSFGLRVTFYPNLKDQNNHNSNIISVFQLRHSLQRIKRQSFVPHRLKPFIPVKDFIKQYLEILLLSTSNVIKFLQIISNQQNAAFQMFIDILKDEFPQEKIQICRNISTLSEELKKINHAFYVHQVGTQIYFTYNRIQGFRTKNPLVAVLAFFTEAFKTHIYRQRTIVKDLNKFFKQKKQ